MIVALLLLSYVILLLRRRASGLPSRGVTFVAGTPGGSDLRSSSGPLSISSGPWIQHQGQLGPLSERLYEVECLGTPVKTSLCFRSESHRLWGPTEARKNHGIGEISCLKGRSGPW